MTRAIQPRELNQADVLAGGFLMTWMDEIAGITSQRYAGPPVTTVGMTDEETSSMLAHIREASF